MSDLDEAQPWSADLAKLLARHPRIEWPKRASANAELWLATHERFRQAIAALEAAAADGRARRMDGTALATQATPALADLLSGLHDHHRVEDYDYFPALRRAAAKLAPAFDALEQDHVRLGIHAMKVLRALADLRAVAQHRDPATLQLAAERYFVTLSAFSRELRRHLEEEETLVVPLLLERDQG